MLYKYSIQNNCDANYNLSLLNNDDSNSNKEKLIHHNLLYSKINKLFDGDILDEEYRLVESPVRSLDYIPGILILSGKTYGRSNNGKFLYKCVPYNNKIPHFLIPYQEKKTGFQKNPINKYVLFKFKEWTSKHPLGILTYTIGNITELENYYDYKLNASYLNIPNKNFISKLNQSLIETNPFSPNLINIVSKNNNIQNRIDYNIISIDPENCRDIDDAIGLQNNILSIYISNVPILLETLNLWKNFSERISTIYLPNKKLTMLPPLLSDNLCSLISNNERYAFCIDIHLKNVNSQYLIERIEYASTIIKVVKNYVYEENNLLNDKLYINILDICKNLCKTYNYISSINDSHDLISYLMLLMNTECAKTLSKYNDGIYRSAELNKISNTENFSPEIFDFIKIWKSTSGSYSLFNNRKKHELIHSSDYYVHITSPIRRLVDLLNIIKIQEHLLLFKMSNDASLFYEKWIKKIEYINEKMTNIRKIQNDCSILHLCITNSAIINEIYKGYLFDKIQNKNNLLFNYSVYLPKLKFVSKLTIDNDELENTMQNFKLFIIEDGFTLYRKLRIKIV